MNPLASSLPVLLSPRQQRLAAEKLAADRKAALRRVIVDEFGDLSKLLTPYKPDFVRLAAMAKTIREWYAHADAASPFTVPGDHYVVTLGPKGNETSIDDMQGVYQALGHDAFLALVKMTLGDLAKSVPNAGVFTVATQTGPRSLTVTAMEEQE